MIFEHLAPFFSVMEVDGSYGEGGGQILRTALALSALTGTPVRIYNIRKKRPRPGLQPQHLAVVRALESITNASVSGAYLDSMEITFRPREIRGGVFSVNIGTAGSVSLLIQAILPVLLFAPEPSRVKIVGGTDVEKAPPVDYMIHVLLPFLARMGASVRLRLLRRGYFPKGGGVVILETHPVDVLRPVRILDFSPGEIYGISHCGALPRHVAERQANAARKRLEEAGYEAEIEVEVWQRSEVLSPGSGITLWLNNVPMGASALGRKGVVAEVVGKSAANYLLREMSSGAPLDRWMGDQVIPYIALAAGRSAVRVSQITLHTVTNMHVAEMFLRTKFDVEREEGKTARIEVNGVGFKREERNEGNEDEGA